MEINQKIQFLINFKFAYMNFLSNELCSQPLCRCVIEAAEETAKKKISVNFSLDLVKFAKEATKH